MFGDPTYRWLRWLNRGLGAAGLGWGLYWTAPPELAHFFIAFAGVAALFALWLAVRHLVRRVRREL